MKTLSHLLPALLLLATPAVAQVPQLINYQGRVAVDGVNFDGSGQFKFALVNASGQIGWSNDGTIGSDPAAAVSLTVTKGLYSVLLGSTNAIPANLFSNDQINQIYLRVWFNDGVHGFQLLTPDQRIASTGYAFMAETVRDGSIINAKIADGAVGSSKLDSYINMGSQASLSVGCFFAGPLNASVTTLDVSGSINGGSLSITGSKNFKIDHPLDPANKYLVHSCIESPDVMNIYNGNITTDARGLATVALPEYFEALNHDFRYQLTVMGQFAQAIVAEKIKGNRFIIQTDKPNIEVSWQVTGIRQDAWMKAHPTVVEQAKPAEERGLYQDPALFGQPKEKGLAWARTQEQMKQLSEARAKSKTPAQLASPTVQTALSKP